MLKIILCYFICNKECLQTKADANEALVYDDINAAFEDKQERQQL